MSTGGKKAVHWRAWQPVLVVLLLDAAAAISTHAVLQLFAPHTTAIPAIWPSLMAGVAAPVLIRARTSARFRALGNRNLFGPLRHLQERAERDIDEICTGQQNSWLEEIVTELAPLSMDQLARWVENDLTRKAGQRLIRATAEDADASEHDRRLTILHVLATEKGHHSVRVLIRHARRNAPDQTYHRGPRYRRWLRGMTFTNRKPADRLRRDLTLPDELRAESTDGRVRIYHADRRIDAVLHRVAEQLRREIRSHATLEGIYSGWIVLRPTACRKHRKGRVRTLDQVSKQLQQNSHGPHVLVQRDAAVLHHEEYVRADLAVMPSNAPRASHGYSGDGFCANGILLAIDAGYNSDVEEAHGHKRHFHAAAQVPLYLVIDMDRRLVILFAEPQGGAYRIETTFDFGEKVTFPPPFGGQLVIAS